MVKARRTTRPGRRVDGCSGLLLAWMMRKKILSLLGWSLRGRASGMGGGEAVKQLRGVTGYLARAVLKLPHIEIKSTSFASQASRSLG